MSFMFFERDVGCGPSVSAVWWASCFGVGIDHGTSEVGGRLRIFGRSVNQGPFESVMGFVLLEKLVADPP